MLGLQEWAQRPSAASLSLLPFKVWPPKRFKKLQDGHRFFVIHTVASNCVSANTAMLRINEPFVLESLATAAHTPKRPSPHVKLGTLSSSSEVAVVCTTLSLIASPENWSRSGVAIVHHAWERRSRGSAPAEDPGQLIVPGEEERFS